MLIGHYTLVWLSFSTGGMLRTNVFTAGSIFKLIDSHTRSVSAVSAVPRAVKIRELLQITGPYKELAISCLQLYTTSAVLDA